MSELREKIKTNDEYVVGSLIALYNMQTADEQMADTTVHQNNLGFNAFDSKVMSDVSKFYLTKGFLTAKQIQMIKPKLLKYMRQLDMVGVEPMPVNKNATKTEKRKRKRKIGKKASIENKDRIRVDFDYDKEIVATLKKIHNYWFYPDKKYWTIPFIVTNVEKLLKMDFQLSDQLKDWYDKQVKGLEEEIYVPGLDDILRPFQKKAVNYIESRKGRVLIADEMGLGKTLEAIAWVQLHQQKLYPAIIVCPSSVKINWKKEFHKFTDLGDDVEILRGTTPYEVSKPILVINYDIVFNWYEYLKTLDPKLIIADEIHKCKTRGTGMKTVNGQKKKVIITQRSAAVEELAKKARFFIGLTGTPILNYPAEIYNPLKMIKPNLFPNFKKFGNRYCDPKSNGFAIEYKGASNTIELNQILTREVMIRRKKEEVAPELPAKTRAMNVVEIDNRKEYERALADVIAYLTEIDPEKAARAMRAEVLAKIATLKRLIVRGKFKQSVEWVSDFIEGNGKLVLFCHHREIADELEKKFKKQCVKLVGGMSDKKKNEAEERFWNEDKVKLFIGNLQAAGEGINLQNASNAAFLEYPWQPGAYKQCEDRVYRIGTTKPVTIWNLVAENTVEVDFVTLLEEKAKVMAEVVDGDESENRGLFNEMINVIKNAA